MPGQSKIQQLTEAKTGYEGVNQTREDGVHITICGVRGLRGHTGGNLESGEYNWTRPARLLCPIDQHWSTKDDVVLCQWQQKQQFNRR